MSKQDTVNPNNKKQALGRGLGSLLGGGNDSVLGKVVDDGNPFEIEVAAEEIAEESIERHPSHFEDGKASLGKIYNIEIEKVVANQQQPRKHFEKEKLAELAASIKQQGILSPIVARKNKEGLYEIIAGERRWRAAQMAGLHQVPVILKEADEKKVLELALIENIQRADLNPVEESMAYKLLMDEHSMTQQDIADQVGKDRSTVTNSLRLLSLPPEVVQFIREAKISTGHAKVLLGLGDPKVQISVAKQIVAKKLSVRATEKLIHLMKAQAGPGKTPSEGEVVRQKLVNQVREDLQKRIGSKVMIDYKNSKGKISLQFYSDDQFNQIVETLKGAWNQS